MRRGRFGLKLIGMGLALALLSACGGGERGRNAKPLEAYSAKELYQQAELRLETLPPRKADKAAELFAEVERLYPYSEWAKRALIMQAFAYHKARDYENARAAAQRFLDFYPADEDAAYAQYLLALSYYDQIDLIGRDQGLTFQALQALRTVIERYPDSDYARSAILKFDLAFDHLAAKEMEIGRYYLKHALGVQLQLIAENLENGILPEQASRDVVKQLEQVVEMPPPRPSASANAARIWPRACPAWGRKRRISSSLPEIQQFRETALKAFCTGFFCARKTAETAKRSVETSR